MFQLNGGKQNSKAQPSKRSQERRHREGGVQDGGAQSTASPCPCHPTAEQGTVRATPRQGWAAPGQACPRAAEVRPWAHQCFWELQLPNLQSGGSKMAKVAKTVTRSEVSVCGRLQAAVPRRGVPRLVGRCGVHGVRRGPGGPRGLCG